MPPYATRTMRPSAISLESYASEADTPTKLRAFAPIAASTPWGYGRSRFGSKRPCRRPSARQYGPRLRLLHTWLHRRRDTPWRVDRGGTPHTDALRAATHHPASHDASSSTSFHFSRTTALHTGLEATADLRSFDTPYASLARSCSYRDLSLALDASSATAPRASISRWGAP